MSSDAADLNKDQSKPTDPEALNELWFIDLIGMIGVAHQPILSI